MAVEAIVSVVIDKFTVFITDESQVFAAGVKHKVILIRSDLQAILPNLSYGEDKKQTNDHIKHLAAQVRDLAYEAEDMLDTFMSRTERRKKQIIIKRYTFIFNDLFARLKFFKEIKRIGARIRPFHIPLGSLNPEQSLPFEDERIVRETSPLIYKGDKIYNVEEDVERLVSRLVVEGGSEQRVISIVGMGGLGKTTLAHLTYRRDVVVRHFDHRAWIHVSSENTERGLLKHTWDSIMYRTTAEVNNLSTEQKKTRMCEYLKDKKYLIVLDDVRDVKDWEFLQGALPETSNGSRVLLTTRQNSIASSVVDPTSPPHEMKPLSQQRSWDLFWDVLRYFPPEPLLDIAEQIVMKCGGLPAAIIVVAGLLRSKSTVQEWSRVLRDFSWDQLDMENSFCKILDLGYKDLAFQLRPLFLYFLVFPKEHEIPVRRLFGLWQSEGIAVVKREETVVSWEDLAHAYLAELIDRKMIRVVKRKLDGKPKTCQIAGIVHDFFLSKASDLGIFHIDQHNNNSTTNLAGVRRLVEYADINDFSSLNPHIRKSRSYISFNFRNGDVPAQVTGRFLGRVIKRGGFGLLGVLDLERVYKPELPESLGKLYRLKYLGLRWTFLDALPSSVGDLSYLETLDVKHTYVSHLPSSIWKLKYLQHLYLNEIHLDVSSSTGHIASLGKNLQTLLGLSIIDMENPTKDILFKLITLKKLGLTCQGTTTAEVFVKWISKLTALETLRLRSIDGYGRPSGLELGSFSRLSHLSNLYLLGWLVSVPALELPQNLTVLTLSVSQLKQDPMPILEKLPKLRALRLLAHSYRGKEMVCSDGGFPSLCILKLWMLVELEEWSVEKGAMANLEELEIRCCKRLKNVPQELLQLDSLKALVLTNMPQAFIDEVKAKKKDYTSLLVNNDWEFPTFADQVTSSLGVESSEIVPNISA